MTKSNEGANPLTILVTGGSGFLGRAIVEEFLDVDSPVAIGRIVVFDIKPFGKLNDHRVSYICGDVCNPEDIRKACAGVDAVIHTAAIVDWGAKSPKEVYRVNFTGTQNVIQACKDNKVPMLVYTSTLDTVITGKPLVNIDESLPYPDTHLNMYCESKCLAEKRVMAEHSDTFRTIVLRPSDVWGERDPYHIPPLIAMARSGFYVRIGDGSARNQHVYVRNMAWAHVLALVSLVEGNEKALGKAYFITDSAGANFFTFFDEIVMRAGYKIRPRNLWLPKGLLYAMGAAAEQIAFLVRPIKYYVPKLSRFAVMYTTTDFTFTSEKAQKDFGFYPRYSQEQAMENTLNYLKGER